MALAELLSAYACSDPRACSSSRVSRQCCSAPVQANTHTSNIKAELNQCQTARNQSFKNNLHLNRFLGLSYIPEFSSSLMC